MGPERILQADAVRHLNRIYEETAIGLCYLDTDLRYIHINKWLAAINGLEVEKHLGRTIGEVLPDVAAGVESQLRHVIESGQALLRGTVEAETAAHPGAKRHYEHNYYPVRSDDGTVVGVSCSVQDITERRWAEKDLQEAHAQLERRVQDRTQELQRTTAQLRTLLETTQIIPWEANADTYQFTYVGPQAVKILGYTLEQWFETGFWPAHIHPDDREDAIDFCVRSSNSKDHYEFEYRMLASDGRIVWITDLVSVIREDGKPRTLQGFMIDITQRKRAELLQAGRNRVLEMVAEGKLLREVLDELACVVENQYDQEILCSILLLDEQEAVLRHGAGPNLPEEYNRAIDGIAIGPCVASCGTAAHRKKRVIVTDTLQDPLWKDFRELAQRFNLRACWSEPILSRHGKIRGTIAVYHRRVYRPSDDDISLLEKIAPLAAVAIEHARAQEKLCDLGRRLIRSQEDERRRIARELHDDFSQRLSLLSVELDQASQRLPESPARTCELMQDLSNRTKRLSTDVHRLSHQLHPVKLEHLGLVVAVKSFCRELSEHEGIRIEFTHREVPTSITRDVALCIYRIVQEALRNVVRHSGIGEARVELTGGRDAIRLQVSDLGVGFEPASFDRSKGLGLISIRERLRLVGGKISIQSQPSRGTRIDVRVPWSATGR